MLPPQATKQCWITCFISSPGYSGRSSQKVSFPRKFQLESYGLGGYDSIVSTCSFYDSWQNDGVLTYSQHSVVVSVIVSNLVRFVVPFKSALQREPQALPSLKTGLSFPRCPALLTRLAELFMHLMDVAAEEVLLPLWSKVHFTNLSDV